MKNKFKKLLGEINLFIRSEKFLIIFIFIILNNIYGIMSLISSDKTFITAFLSIYTNPFYLLIIQILILISVNITLEQTEKNYSLIIRFKNHREYLKELFKKVLRNSLVIFIINLIISLLALCLIRGFDIGVKALLNYNISNVLYAFFYIIRTCTIILLNALVFLYIMKNINKSIGIVLCLFYIISNLLYQKNPLYIFYFDYFNILICETFIEEVIRSVIFIGIFEVILKIFHEYTAKHMKKLGD